MLSNSDKLVRTTSVVDKKNKALKKVHAKI